MAGLLVKKLILTEKTNRPEKDCLQRVKNAGAESVVADKKKYRRNSQAEKAGNDI